MGLTSISTEKSCEYDACSTRTVRIYGSPIGNVAVWSNGSVGAYETAMINSAL